MLHHYLYTCSTLLRHIDYTVNPSHQGALLMLHREVHACKVLLLQFDYRERAHAVGKMPRSRTQKEFSHSDREVAVSALMDRAFKPLFPPGFSRFCQVRPGNALLLVQWRDAHLCLQSANAPRVQLLLPGGFHLCGPDGSFQPSIGPSRTF